MSQETNNNPITEIGIDSFDEQVLQSPIPVLVDFWAPWCGPCKAIAPILEGIAASHNNLRIVKVNVDDNRDLAVKYGVQAIPTLMIFKEGGETGRKIGGVDATVLQAFIKESIA